MGFNEAGAALGRRRRILSCWGVGAVLAVAMIGSIATAGWRTASRESAQLAPLPSEEPAAVVQAYAAAVYGWRGFLRRPYLDCCEGAGCRDLYGL